MSGNASFYDYINWLSLGFADTVKGAVMPEEPLSLQHWVDSANVIGTACFFYKASQFRNIYKTPKTVIFPPKPRIQFTADPNRINHIMSIHHAWNRVNATTWDAVKNVIEYTVLNGTCEPYGNGNFLFSCIYGNETIKVNVCPVDEVLNIVDAWVKTK